MIAVVTYTALCADALMMLYETVGHSVVCFRSGGTTGLTQEIRSKDTVSHSRLHDSLPSVHCLSDFRYEWWANASTRHQELHQPATTESRSSKNHTILVSLSHKKSICLQSFGVKYNLYDLLSTHVTNHLWKQFTISI